MINCLTNYVTLSRGCSVTTPESGIYLDAIRPEIRMDRLEQLTGPDQKTIAELFNGNPSDTNDNGIYGRGVLRLETDTRTRMAGKFTRRNVVESVLSHEYEDELGLTTAGAEYRGVYIESNASPFTDIWINHVHLYAQTGGPINILVFDAQTGTTLDTIAATVSAGYNRIAVNKSYSTEGRTRRLFVAYDATSFVSYDTRYLDDFGEDCHCDCAGDPGDYMEVKGGTVPTTSQVIEDNISKMENSHGLIVSVNLMCSVGAFICQRKEDFKMAFVMALTIEFLLEAQQSDRINRFTVFMDSTAIDDHLYGSTTTRKVGLFDQYATILDNLLDDIHADDGICFECDDMVTIHPTIP